MNICVLLMTIFRKTTKSTAPRKMQHKILNRKKFNNLDISQPRSIAFFLLQFFAFHQFLSNHTGLRQAT